MENRSIYIMISQTHSKFAYCIRKLGRTKYNHAAISLDAELNELYAFARPQHNAVLLAKLIHENVYRYTLGKFSCVNVVIFKIDVTEDQYDRVSHIVSRIHNDHEYIYNMLSVLTFPLSGGFKTYKAFSCIEFVMYILKGLGYKLDKPFYSYKPDELVELLGDNICFEGNLLDYKNADGISYDYYAPMTYKIFCESASVLKKTFLRSILRRPA